jgi:hypothetical protein
MRKSHINATEKSSIFVTATGEMELFKGFLALT